jgi:hypothetical protein
MESELYISRQCEVHAPGAQPFTTVVGILKPQQLDKWKWKCTLYLGEISNEERHAIGIDAWHAIQSGMQMVFIELEFRQLQGWKFLWFEGDSDDLEELLPPVGRALPDHT